MRVLLASLLLAASLAVFSQSSSTAYLYSSINSAHQIELASRSEITTCSSVAVGKHTLLSAAHCMIGTGTVSVDSNDRAILSAVYDDNDHVLIVVDGPEFPVVSQMDQRTPVKGEHVHIWGWPGNAKTPVYRDGVFKSIEPGDDPLLVWQLPVFHGDSGSGVIDDHGKVINVVSLGNGSAEMKDWPLAFDPNQLQEIK